MMAAPITNCPQSAWQDSQTFTLALDESVNYDCHLLIARALWYNVQHRPARGIAKNWTKHEDKMSKQHKLSKILGEARGELSPESPLVGGVAMSGCREATALPGGRDALRRVRIGMFAACVAVAAAVHADLPVGYTQLPYIKANANVQVRTGYTPAATDKIVMTWCQAQDTAIETLWCARSGYTTKSFTVFAYAGKKIGINYNNVSLSDSSTPASFTVNKRDNLAAYTKYTIIADGNAKTLAVTNAFTGAEVVNVSWTVASDFTVGSQLCLFASHASDANSPAGNWSSHFLYSFKVYDAAGTLKLDLVPAKNSGGTVGLYNTVGNNFLTKSTTTGSLTDALIDKTFDDFTLIDDEVFGTVTVNSGKTLNLNGHNLTASAIAGSGTITDTMVDLTEPDSNGNHVSSTTTFYGGTAANLFNNNFARSGTDNTKRIIIEKAKLPLVVDYDFWSPRIVNLYKIYCGPISGAQARCPKSWEFYGSNDKENWTLLDSRSNITWPATQTTRSYSFTNTTAYRYYRFKGLTSNDSGYYEMVQLEYFFSRNGELHLNVPSGKTVNNSTVSLTGKFRLFKEGEGAYIAAKANQSYTGGTELRGGTIDSSSASLAKPFGNEPAVAVFSRLDVHALNYSRFNIKDGATIDLSGCEGAYDAGNFAFASGANVTIDVTGRTIDAGTRIMEWGAKPQNVTFAFDPFGVEPVVGGTGLFYGLVNNVAEFAWWTGAGQDGDPTNPANWACTNAAGNVIADGLPSAPTAVFFAGNVSVQTLSGYSLAPYRCVVKDCTLMADSDMRGFGPLEIASGCTLNLNGHALQATEVVGAGTITGDLSDLTEPDPNAERVTSDPATFTNFATYHAKSLFNNNFTTAQDPNRRLIIQADQLPLKVDYDFGDGTPQLINAYRIYFEQAASYAPRAPKHWKFYGSDDKNSWTLLDERTSETGWGTKENRTYRLTNTTPYRYYRIEFLENNNNNEGYLEIVQLEYFYDDDNVGELHLHVPAGVTNTNSTVSFNGKIKLVKEGEGTFVAAKTDQQYTGGTDILGGTVKLASGAQAQLLGAANSQVCVTAGATLDVFDCRMAYYYKVVSGGGTLTNSGSGLSSGLAQLGSLTLTADSVLDSTHSLGFVYASYGLTELDLGGHVLDVNTGSGGVFRMTNCDATNGTVRVVTTGTGIMSFVNGEVRAATVDFDLSCKVCPYQPTTVRNLLLRAPCATQQDTVTISVLGSFTTETLDFPNVRLEDGSTLDLSGQEGTLNTAGSSSHASQYYITFAPGATVAVDVGARGVAAGDCLASWPAGLAPAASVKFVLCANGVPVEGKSIGVVESGDRHGIYVKASGTPDYAMWDGGWKFFTQDGQEVSGWTGGVTGDMQVRFSTAAEYTAFCDAGAVTPSAFVLTADSLTIPAGTSVDLDRTGTIAINEGTVFDVNGGHLKLPASLAGGIREFMVTNSAEQVGTLEIAVAEGESAVNAKMALTGELKFQKTGAGTFTAAKSAQTYSGGTVVEGGVLSSALNGTASPFGTGAITAAAGGTFDFDGKKDFYSYQMILDGGTIRNTGADVGSGTAEIGSMDVTADGSRIEVRSSVGFINTGYAQAQLNLHGHTLTVDIASGKGFWFDNVVVDDGTLDVTGAGNFVMDKTGIIATNVSFRIGAAMSVNVPVSVRDYIALYGDVSNSGTAALKVYGTFKPSAHNFFYGCTMQAGSTIDLSERTSPLPTVSDFVDGDHTLKFASGATVTIDVGDRAASLARGTRLMSWSAIPGGVTFTFGAEATQAGIEPVLTATGLFYGEAGDVAELAWWTGAGNDGDPTNPDNWTCRNASGDEIEDGLPSSSTIVYIGGDAASEITLQPSSGYALVPSGCVVSNCTLAADCDWRAFGALEIANGCTLNLNGHRLYATGIAGSGTIAGSSDLTEPDGDGTRVSCNNTLYSTSKAANLFNNNYARAGTDNNKRLIMETANLPLEVDYDFGAGTVVNCYNMYCGPEAGNRRPTEWEFYGSDDKANWTLLDARRSMIWPNDTKMTRAFAFENTTPYRYYRFKCIKGSTDSYLEMVQLEYFGPAPGELHLDIPAETTLINTSVALTGYMKLVKEGGGTYIGKSKSQSYSGGTLVAAGRAQPGVGAAANGNSGYLYIKPFGYGSITVAQGATFDVRSNYDYVYQEIVLDGGTFVNSWVDMTKSDWAGSTIWGITADSDMGVTNTLVFGRGTMDLNGNTLSVDITPAKTLYLGATVITNGTIDIKRGGWLNFVGATDARTVDFRIGCALNVGAALNVHDYVAAYDYDANSGTAALNVYGAFKPTTAYFYGPTMQDGSTLDLSAWPGGWPLASGFTSGNTAISFADGATIKVSFGATPVGKVSGKKVLGWDAAPASVDFAPAAGERFGLRKQDDGLYIYRGLIIIMR